MEHSILDRVRARLKAARCDRWHLVAHVMAGNNPAAGMMLLKLVDDLHEARAERVTISLASWRAELGYGKARVGNSAMALAAAGVRYLNHVANVWFIDEDKFWAAFDAALKLVCPDLPETGNPAGNPPGDLAGNRQGGEDAQGGDPAGNPPLILKEREKRLTDIFRAFRLKFAGDLTRLIDGLLEAAANLDEAATKKVVTRCMYAGGHHWSYVLRSLANESARAGQPQQLALFPGVEVPKPKNDLRIVTEAPAATWDWSPQVESAELKTDLQMAQSPEAERWETAAEQLRHTDRRFQEYLADAAYVRTDGEALVVRVASGSARDLLQTRLYRNVVAAVGMVFGKTTPVRFEVAG